MLNNKSESMSLKKFNRILVIQTAFIGDVILVTPLIHALTKLFPNAKVDILVTPMTSNILENNPYINSILIFNKRKNKIYSFFKILNEIKSKKYDIAFSPHSSITTALLMFLSKIPVRVGFDRWTARFLLTHKVPHLSNVHKIEKILNLITPFSKEKYSVQTSLFPSDENEKKGKKLVADLSTRKIIAIAPGSNWFTKKWPKEYYKELVQKLSDLDFGLVFIGSKDEKEICEDIDPQRNSINLAGELTLLESAAVISMCELMICNDSGALHIADAMETDVISFFGPTVQSIGYYPFRANDTVLEVDLECRPCSSHGSNKCPLGHHDCMRLIKPDYVIQQILNKLNQS